MKERTSVPLAAHLAVRVREIREQKGWTQDELARRARKEAGLDWARDAVAGIERGIRELTIAELFLMPLVLEVDLSALLQGAKRVELSHGVDVDERYLGLVLQDEVQGLGKLVRKRPQERYVIFPPRRGRPAATGTTEEAGKLSVFGEAEQKAAARLNVRPEEVEAASLELWGRGFTDEREKRIGEVVEGAGKAPPTPRALQALRGHVSRRLIGELAEKLSRRGFPRGDRRR